MTPWYEDPDTLWSYLQAHKKEIWYVQLIWTWPEYIEKETPLYYKGPDGGPWTLYARWTAERIDEEYTIIGTIEEAIKFAESYECWDSRIEDMRIEDGILMDEYEGYDPNGYEYPNDEPADRDLYNLDYSGLYFYGNDHKAHPYNTYYKVPPLNRNAED